MTENNEMPIVVYVRAGESYRNATYGIVLQSVTEHVFDGRGIHNRHFRHLLQVWDNIDREQEDGTYMDPMLEPTTERYSYMWSAQAGVISSAPIMSRALGESLHLGDSVELRLEDSGYVIGTFKIHAKPHHDPHMVKYDATI